MTCGTGCAACEYFTGDCKECTDSTNSVSPDGKSCSDCAIPVGKVGQATNCVSEAYSLTRVVPPFADDAEFIDWRDWGVVNNVTDQGSCGSCYAFSTIEAAESSYAIATGELYKLSEQHIVSCDSSNWACDGGLQWYASRFLAQQGTILDSDYPYTSYYNTVPTCIQSDKNRVFYLESPNGYSIVGSSFDAFKAALRIEPINISFAVGNDFMYYSSGIYGANAACASNLNHAM